MGERMKLSVAMLALMAYPSPMTTLTLDLPEALTAELDAAVEAGWFTSQEEAVRAAVRDMMSHRKLALLEQQQISDIDWAMSTASKRP
jgi:Arc/MetJ-type ribon-helix-helix transcriptional regulator